MTDVHAASNIGPVCFVRAFEESCGQRPGTLSPDPWHFALFASSMVQEQGDASTMTASPLPLDCCGARGACQQSPILHSSTTRLNRMCVDGKRQAEDTCDERYQERIQTASFCYHAIGVKRQMPGVWGQSPQGVGCLMERCL